MRISDFIEQSNQIKSPEALLKLMQRAADDLGFDKYAYCALTHHHLYNGADERAPAVAFNFPDSWVDYYFEQNYQTIDPVLLYPPQLEVRSCGTICTRRATSSTHNERSCRKGRRPR